MDMTKKITNIALAHETVFYMALRAVREGGNRVEVYDAACKLLESTHSALDDIEKNSSEARGELEKGYVRADNMLIELEKLISF